MCENDFKIGAELCATTTTIKRRLIYQMMGEIQWERNRDGKRQRERGTQGKHTKFWQLLIVQRAVQDFVYLTWTAATIAATTATAIATTVTTTTCLLSMQLQNASLCQGQIMLRFSFYCEITHSKFNLSFSLRPPDCRDKRSSQSGKMVLSFTPQLAKAAGEMCLALPHCLAAGAAEVAAAAINAA